MGKKSEIKKCPECGMENNIARESCCECGYQFPKEENKKSVNLQKLHGLKKSLIRVAVVCLLISAFFFYKGYDVKNNYYNSDYSLRSTNAYVGGDAYNYIINGNYFTGYAVIASTFMLSGVLLFCSAVGISSKIKISELE